LDSFFDDNFAMASMGWNSQGFSEIAMGFAKGLNQV